MNDLLFLIKKQSLLTFYDNKDLEIDDTEVESLYSFVIENDETAIDKTLFKNCNYLNRIASKYKYLNENDKMIMYYEKSIKLKNPNSMWNLSIYYGKIGKQDKALQLRFKASSYFKPNEKNKNGILLSIRKICIYYRDKGNI